MLHNDYIKTGYRINFDSYTKLTRSLFMLHNETINVWTHLIGGLIFMYLVRHTFTTQEPSEFYYQMLLHNEDRTHTYTDLGIPYNTLYKRVKHEFEKQQQSMASTSTQLLTYLDDFKSEMFPTVQTKLSFIDAICSDHGAADWPPFNSDDTAVNSCPLQALTLPENTEQSEQLMQQLTNQFNDLVLNSDKLEEWFEIIKEKKSNIYVFWDSQKALHAHTYEALELYMQTAVDRLGDIKKQVVDGLEDISNFKEQQKLMSGLLADAGNLTNNQTLNQSIISQSSMQQPLRALLEKKNQFLEKLFECKICVERLVKIIEGVPLSLQTKINTVMGQLSNLTQSDMSVMKQDELNLQMQMDRMAQYVEVMKVRVDNWKHLIEDQIDEKRSGISNAWHSFTNDPAYKIEVHYTARWPLIVNYICCVCCFGFSAFYHLYSSHSKEIMDTFIKFDYAGISLMIAGSSTPPIYYAFSCPELRPWLFVYLGLIYFLVSITLILILVPFFNRDDLHAFRAGAYFLTGMSNLFPIIHIVLYVEPHYLQDFHLYAWVVGCLFYICGAALYVSRYPEKCCPCKFDIVGQSHQLFHICIVLAALTHYYAGIQIFHERQLQACPIKYNVESIKI